MYLLLDTRKDEHFAGKTIAEVLDASDAMTYDPVKRCAVIKGQPDGVIFGQDYAPEEAARQAQKRALHVLCRDYGFQFFTSIHKQ